MLERSVDQRAVLPGRSATGTFAAAVLWAVTVLPIAPSQAQAPAAHPHHGSHQTGGPVYRAGSLTIEAPWSRATPGGARVAGGYLRITNGGSGPDRLVGGSLAAARGVQLHETSTAGGVARMRPVEQGLAIGAGETVELKPGGHHLMFTDLQRPLKEGETLRGTLVFEKAGTVTVEFAVRSIGAQADGHGHQH